MLIKNIYGAIKYRLPLHQTLKYIQAAIVRRLFILMVIIINIPTLVLHYSALIIGRLADAMANAQLWVRDQIGIGSKMDQDLEDWEDAKLSPLRKKAREIRLVEKCKKENGVK